MAVYYDQLHMATNNPTKFEWNPLSGLGGVASTKSTVAYVQKNQQSPITRVKFVESKWRYNMMNYIWWLTIPQNLNGIRWADLEELNPQSCDGQTHGYRYFYVNKKLYISSLLIHGI